MAAASSGEAGRRPSILVLSIGLAALAPGPLLTAVEDTAAGTPAPQEAGATPVIPADVAQAAAAIARLRGEAAGVTIPEQLKGEMARVTDAFSLAQADLDAGRAHLAWWRLSSAVAELTALRAYAGNKDEAAAFDSEKARAGDLEGAAKHALADPALARASALRRALAEAALNVVPRYQSSGSAFAKASQPGSGIYYLNMGRGHLEFAKLAVGAEPGAAPESPAGVVAAFVPPALGDRLLALEQSTAEAYAKPGAAVAQHPQFIALSATLKEAQELSAAGLLHGALYKHLDALRRLAAIVAPVPPREKLARHLETMRARLAAASGDQGIGRLFWEMAAFNLDGDGPDEKERLQRAAAILEGVLPEYFGILERRDAPAIEAAAAARKEEVRLTLVRWPST